LLATENNLVRRILKRSKDPDVKDYTNILRDWEDNQDKVKEDLLQVKA